MPLVDLLLIVAAAWLLFDVLVVVVALMRTRGRGPGLSRSPQQPPA